MINRSSRFTLQRAAVVHLLTVGQSTRQAQTSSSEEAPGTHGIHWLMSEISLRPKRHKSTFIVEEVVVNDGFAVGAQRNCFDDEYSWIVLRNSFFSYKYGSGERS